MAEFYNGYIKQMKRLSIFTVIASICLFCIFSFTNYKNLVFITFAFIIVHNSYLEIKAYKEHDEIYNSIKILSEINNYDLDLDIAAFIFDSEFNKVSSFAMMCNIGFPTVILILIIVDFFTMEERFTAIIGMLAFLIFNYFYKKHEEELNSYDHCIAIYKKRVEDEPYGYSD